MISVIIPCHNSAAFIRNAVASVLNQSYQDTEIILVNNNSTDETFSILKEYQKAYVGKISVYDETTPGAPAARNLGLSKAKGEWIQFLDADDELLPDKLLLQLSLAENNDADVVAGNCTLKYIIRGKKIDIIKNAYADTWKGLISSNLGITSSNLWRKQSLVSVSGWDENITSSQEYDLLFRLLKNKAKIITDNAFNTIIYCSENSISKTRDEKKLIQILDDRIALRSKIKQELQSSGLLTKDLDREIDTYIYTQIMRCYYNIPQYARSLLKKQKFKVSFNTVIELRARLFMSYLRPKA